MAKKWNKGTVNAKDLGNGNFISTDIQKKRVELLRNNTEYRENIEKAQRVAGYEDKLLLAARGIQENAIQTILNQSQLAEQAITGGRNETVRSSGLITLS